MTCHGDRHRAPARFASLCWLLVGRRQKGGHGRRTASKRRTGGGGVFEKGQTRTGSGEVWQTFPPTPQHYRTRLTTANILAGAAPPRQIRMGLPPRTATGQDVFSYRLE